MFLSGRDFKTKRKFAETWVSQIRTHLTTGQITKN